MISIVCIKLLCLNVSGFFILRDRIFPNLEGYFGGLDLYLNNILPNGI